MTLNLTYHRSAGGGKMVEEGIEPGVHQAVIKMVEKDQKRKYQSEELEDCLRVDFEIDGMIAYQKFTPSLHEKANLYKFIKGLNPGAISGGQLNTDASANEIVENLIGRKCMVQIEEKVTKTGNSYLAVGSVLPVTSKNGASKKKAEKVDAKEVSFEDDDIPF